MATEVGALFDHEPLDLSAMRRANYSRLVTALKEREVGAAWLLSPGHLRFLVGSAGHPSDAERATCQRASLLIDVDSEFPHLFTPDPESAPAELPANYIHPQLELQTKAEVAESLTRLWDVLGKAPEDRIAIDEYVPALFGDPSLLRGLEINDAGAIIGAIKVCKSNEEIECVRRAQRINERAMEKVQSALRVGLRQSDLSALFFSAIYDLGASANGIDPIWQVMAPRIADGPFTTHGHVAFPTCTRDRLLREGDVLWVDTGIDYEGYQSDFGRTFVVGAQPSQRQLDQGRRWLDVVLGVLEVVRPGATGRDLTQRAIEIAGGNKPWLDHFYLVHGVGTEPAEQPLIGTDLGEAFDEGLVLAPGMILVLEPAIWDDGYAGYRAEEIVAVTETGYTWLSSYPYSPYEASMGEGH